MNKQQSIFLSVCLGALSACTSMDGGYSPYEVVQPYQGYSYENVQYYLPSDGGSDYSYRDYGTHNQVRVPDSYHVGVSHSPASAKDRDKVWISSQNPQSYTIEIANDEKPGQVAKKLEQVPKNEHTAEIKYQEGGKTYYKGVYGSYSNQQDAQKAFDALPDEVKKGAGIQNWQKIQNNANR